MKNILKILLIIVLLLQVNFTALGEEGNTDVNDSGIAADSPDNTKQIQLLAPFTEEEKTIDTSEGSISIIEQWVSQVYLFGAGLTVIVGIFWIVVGGYEIMVSGVGNSADISGGKEKIMQSLLGLTLVFLSALILNTINPNFFTLGL